MATQLTTTASTGRLTTGTVTSRRYSIIQTQAATSAEFVSSTAALSGGMGITYTYAPPISASLTDANAVLSRHGKTYLFTTYSHATLTLTSARLTKLGAAVPPTPTMNRPPITVEAAGLLARAKRRKDYCRVFVDFDAGQWYDGDLDDMSPGIQIDRSGRLRFACAQGSVMATNAYHTLWYHLHGGLSVEQDIFGVSFDWRSLGTMTWSVYETAEPLAGCSWSLLGTDGGSTHAVPESVNYNCSAGMRGLALQVHYAAGKTLSVDEWIEFSELRVRGQAGDVSIGDALTGILVASGLATSYYSVSVS